MYEKPPQFGQSKLEKFTQNYLDSKTNKKLVYNTPAAMSDKKETFARYVKNRGTDAKRERSRIYATQDNSEEDGVETTDVYPRN